MDNAAMIPAGNNMFFDTQGFELAQRVANIFAKSTMVPEHFQGNIGNCMIAMNFANRIGADIFMVMQSMYVIHGKPGIEGKLVIALVNQCGRFEPLEFDEGPDYCIAFAKEIRSKKVLKGSKIDMAMVKAEGWLDKKGSKWKTIPEQMFRYRAAAFFARAYCPEVLLGMQTKEELIDMSPAGNGSYHAADKAQELTEQLTAPWEEEKAEQIDLPPDDFEEKLRMYQEVLGNEPIDKVVGGADISKLQAHEKETILDILEVQATLEAAKAAKKEV